jgi:hypothetical protein
MGRQGAIVTRADADDSESLKEAFRKGTRAFLNPPVWPVALQ